MPSALTVETESGTPGQSTRELEATGPQKPIAELAENEQNVELLLQQLRSRLGLIPWVGAGLSMPSGYPGWSQFLMRESARHGLEGKVKARIDRGQYEEAAEDLSRGLGRQAFNDLIERAYGPASLKRPLTGAVAVVPGITDGPVVTTNFDQVLEQAFEDAGKPFEHRIWGAQAGEFGRALGQDRRYLLKLHGDVASLRTRVLTRTEYNRHYGRAPRPSSGTRHELPRLLDRLFTGRSVLFLGCSLHVDRTLVQLHESSRQPEAQPHFAVVERPQQEAAFRRRARELANHSIRPIWFPEGMYATVETFLVFLIRELHRTEPEFEAYIGADEANDWRGIVENGRKLEQSGVCYPPSRARRALAHDRLGDDFVSDDDYEAAISEYKAAVHLTPSNSQYHSDLALAYAFRGLRQLAGEHLVLASDLGRDIRPERALFALLQQEWTEAIPDLDGLIETSDESSDERVFAHQLRGIAYLALADYDKARQDIEAAVQRGERTLESMLRVLRYDGFGARAAKAGLRAATIGTALTFSKLIRHNLLKWLNSFD